MTKLWQDAKPVDVPEALRDAIGGHPVVAETLVRRGITDVAAAMAYMNWHHYQPAPASDLPNMDVAVERLRRALRDGELIGIWGDFDVDGQTSTALLVSALREMGGRVVSYIPKRLTEGHGIHLRSLNEMLDGGVKLIVTCDTGVDAHEAVDAANKRGVDVIVTDHHKLPEVLPNALAVVNPRRTSPGHPLRDLPGVGVAYKLIEALGGDDYDPTHLLDLVALGIVADVAVQRADTRYLLQRGLAVLSGTKRLGLQELMETAEVNPVDVNEDDIAFRIAPRLNAIGRLGDANPTTDLLTTVDLEQARILVNQLEGLNAERRRLSDEVWSGVQAALEREPHLLKHAALVLAHPAWHTGVVGIVANKCVERYNRPTLLLQAPPDGLAKGSARSVAGVDITDAIAANAAFLEGYGGHTMAAGVALKAEHIDDFRRGLSEQVRAQLEEVELELTVKIDRYMTLDELNLGLVRDVARIAPFGAGNPPLTLATTGLTIKSQRQLGRDGKHQKLTVEDDVGRLQQVVWWNAEDVPTGRFNLAYTVRENTFRGETEVMVEWLDHRRHGADEVDFVPARDIVFHDRRGAMNPMRALTALCDEMSEIAVYGEVVKAGEITLIGRDAVEPVETLVAWTVPPSAGVWRGVLEAARPSEVYLFGRNPGMDEPEAFRVRLSGLVNYALQAYDGEIKIERLAMATAQTKVAVRMGLAWLVTRGELQVVYDGEIVKLSRGGTIGDEAAAMRELRAVLDETAAYRAYWLRAEQP